MTKGFQPYQVRSSETGYTKERSFPLFLFIQLQTLLLLLSCALIVFEKSNNDLGLLSIFVQEFSKKLNLCEQNPVRTIMEAKIDDRLQDLLSNNREFAQTWHNPFSMDQMRAMAKKSGVSMLICMSPYSPCSTIPKHHLISHSSSPPPPTPPHFPTPTTNSNLPRPPLHPRNDPEHRLPRRHDPQRRRPRHPRRSQINHLNPHPRRRQSRLRPPPHRLRPRSHHRRRDCGGCEEADARSGEGGG